MHLFWRSYLQRWTQNSPNMRGLTFAQRVLSSEVRAATPSPSGSPSQRCFTYFSCLQRWKQGNIESSVLILLIMLPPLPVNSLWDYISYLDITLEVFLYVYLWFVTNTWVFLGVWWFLRHKVHQIRITVHGTSLLYETDKDPHSL